VAHTITVSIVAATAEAMPPPKPIAAPQVFMDQP
jgi:hypothetical protein